MEMKTPQAVIAAAAAAARPSALTAYVAHAEPWGESTGSLERPAVWVQPATR